MVGSLVRFLFTCCEESQTHSFAALTRSFAILHNSWIKIVHTHQPWSNLYISLFEDTLHVAKIHVWFKITKITHVLPLPVYRQTDFRPKRVAVSSLHDTGVKFSPWYNNQGKLMLGWLTLAWHFVVYHVNKYRVVRGSRSELAPTRKSPCCHLNTP